MSMVAEKFERFVLGHAPIGMDAIAKAIWDYRERFGRRPEIIRLQSLAYMNLMEQVKPYDIQFDAVMGLKIEHDEKLANGEWRVGNSSEIVTEVPAGVKAGEEA